MDNILKNRFELFLTIMLCVTAFLVAFSGSLSSRHQVIQMNMNTDSYNLAVEGTSEYIDAAYKFKQDLVALDEIVIQSYDLKRAEELEDETVYNITIEKHNLLYDNFLSNFFYSAVDYVEELEASGENVSMYDVEGGYWSFYTKLSDEKYAESDEVLDQAIKHGRLAGNYMMTTVLFSIVLFLLGIAGLFPSKRYKITILTLSCFFFIVSLLYMLFIPVIIT